MEEIFEYRFTKLDPISGDHIDPPSVAVYETLLNKGQGGRPEPGLADAWQVGGDGLTWQFHLRPGATFHSGAPCDAKAVVKALELCRWAGGLDRQIWYWDPVDRVREVSKDVVEVSLLYPCVRLPALLWGTHTAIVNADTRAHYGEDFGVSVADGTGPYRLTDFGRDSVTAERVAVAQSGPGFSHPDRIHWRSVPDDHARLRSLSSRHVDVVRAVDGTGIDPADPHWRLDSQMESSQIYLALNFEDPRGFGDVEIRRAIESFIDREEIVRLALGGSGDSRRSPVPIADEFAGAFDPSSASAMSRADAHATFARLGFTRGGSGVLERDGSALEIDCVVQDTAVFRGIASVVQRQLLAAGVRLLPRFVEPFEDFYRAVEAGPAAFISKWLWPDAMEALMGFSRQTCMGPGGGNWQNASTPRVDLAFDQFLQATSDEELNVASSEAQRLFMSELPFIPLCSPMETLAVRRRIHGFSLSPRTLYPLYGGVTAESSG